MYIELQKLDVIRKLLWEKYANEVRVLVNLPLQYFQFCNHCNQYIEVNKAKVHFDYKEDKKLKMTVYVRFS